MSNMNKDDHGKSPTNESTYRDEEKVRREVERADKYALAWPKHKTESTSAYLARLGNRGDMKAGTSHEITKLDAALKKIALPLSMLTWRFHRSSLAVQARSLNAGYHYCCCTDVDRLATSFKASLTANMTLAELQGSAKRGCVRCWFLVECLAKFEHRWAGVAASQTIVIGGSEAILGSGSVLIFTVFWVEPATHDLKWRLPKWSKLPLEIYYYTGGFPLYPTLKPREEISVDVNAGDCARKILDWIHVCVSSHIFCNAMASGSFTPTRLIDTSPLNDDSDVRLVNGAEITGPDVQYAALSYCWGLPADRVKPIPMTQRATLTRHLATISWQSLTPVFQDAVALTRCLGLRYIWIDALCIVQDDAQDWAREASRMASVYGEAYLVIAATSTRIGDEGLFRRRPEPRQICRSDKTGRVQSVFVREEVEHDAFTTGEPRHFRSTPLFARAWCFQERLLARRVVHFAEHELLFECKEDLRCECDMLSTEYGLYQNFKVVCAYGLAKTSAKNRYQTWYSVLRPYTARSLTFEKDRLPAISGFARLVSTPEMGAYHAGMWEKELPGALLWRVVRALPESQDLIERPKTYRAPTWSWAGIQAVVDGHIKFHDGIDTVASVEEVKCTLASSDLFGEVMAGHLILKAPFVEIGICESTEGVDIERYHYNISRLTESEDKLSFRADLCICDGAALCVAIEHDAKGVHNGRWSCLVLQENKTAGYCYRVGTVELPSHWIDSERARTVKIV